MSKLRTRPFFLGIDSGNVPPSLDRRASRLGPLATIPASGLKLPATALLMPSTEVEDYAWRETMRPHQEPGRHRKKEL